MPIAGHQRRQLEYAASHAAPALFITGERQHASFTARLPLEAADDDAARGHA